MKKVIEEHVGCSVPLPDPSSKEMVIEHLQPVFIQMETYIHGKTKGGDVKTVVRGGFLKIEPESIQSIPSTGNFAILLVDTGVKAKTSMAVAKVISKVDEGPGKQIIDQIGTLTSQIAELLVEPEFETSPAFISKISTNHELLTELGLTIEPIDEIISVFSSYGIPAKISGKGCGGIVIAIMENDESLKSKVTSELSDKGYTVYSPSLDHEGISCTVEG